MLLPFKGGIGPATTMSGLLNRGLKMDEYFGIFSLKSCDMRVFWNDGERISRRTGILS